MLVLLIEDDQAITETVIEMLELNDMEVCALNNCNKALEYLSHSRPDVILCDVMLPDGTGFDILRFLRDTDIIDYIPFIFLSGRAAHEDIRTGMNLGADDYLTKPFEYDDLINSIKTITAKLEHRHERVVHLEEELNTKNKQINEVKNITSHDLRARIVRITNLIDLMRSGHLTPDAFMSWMLKSGEYLDEVVHKIHDVINTVESMQPKSKILSVPPKTIWHIDDDDLQRKVVEKTVKGQCKGVDLKSFSSAKQAMAHIDDGNTPDLILLDINMPKVNGFQFLDYLKKRDGEVQVIMLTSSISDIDITKSYSYQHVVGYEVKPLKLDVINELLRCPESKIA